MLYVGYDICMVGFFSFKVEEQTTQTRSEDNHPTGLSYKKRLNMVETCICVCVYGIYARIVPVI